ncbi:MAG: hypothetical protein FWE19_05600 [Oscillospiraceae bacterium]|nr:hypothetical protein [Oscillospiraceae bacterium]
MSHESYPLVVPRLQFGGQCAEALELYQKVFGATVKDKILFSQANPSDFQYTGKEKDNLIYYAELMIGKHMVMMHDDADGIMYNGRPSATALCVSFDSEQKARAAYELLLDGASILMPITSTSYGVFEVSLSDKFGVQWDLYFGDA